MAYNNGVLEVSGHSNEMIEAQVKALLPFIRKGRGLKKITLCMSTLELVKNVVPYADKVHVDGSIAEGALRKRLLPLLTQHGTKCTALYFRSAKILQMSALVSSFREAGLKVHHGSKLLGNAPSTPPLLCLSEDDLIQFEEALECELLDDDGPSRSALQETILLSSDEEWEDSRCGFWEKTGIERNPLYISDEEEEARVVGEKIKGYSPCSPLPPSHSDKEEDEGLGF